MHYLYSINQINQSIETISKHIQLKEMSFLHDIFFHDTRFEISEASLTELHTFTQFTESVASSRFLAETKSRVKPENVQSPLDVVNFDELRPSARHAKDFSDSPPKVSYESQIASSIETPVAFTARPEHLRKPTQIRLEHPTLFWCVFVAHYGYSEYLRVGNRFQNRELEEKQRMMETLSKNPKQMKEGSMKLTNDAIQEILSGLMVSSNDSFSALVAYSMYYGKTIYVVFECSYLVFSNTKDSDSLAKMLDETCVLYQTRKHPKYGGSYRLESDLTPEKLEQIHSSKIFMEHYAKPFRGISAYKVADLEKMATKIGILDASGKAELYAKVVEKCCLGIQTR